MVGIWLSSCEIFANANQNSNRLRISAENFKKSLTKRMRIRKMLLREEKRREEKRREALSIDSGSFGIDEYVMIEKTVP